MNSTLRPRDSPRTGSHSVALAGIHCGDILQHRRRPWQTGDSGREQCLCRGGLVGCEDEQDRVADPRKQLGKMWQCKPQRPQPHRVIAISRPGVSAAWRSHASPVTSRHIQHYSTGCRQLGRPPLTKRSDEAWQRERRALLLRQQGPARTRPRQEGAAAGLALHVPNPRFP